MVAGESAPLAEVPCFLPVVPRTTSCMPDLLQHMEYPHVKVTRAVSACLNSMGGSGACLDGKEQLVCSTMAGFDHTRLFSSDLLDKSFWDY